MAEENRIEGQLWIDRNAPHGLKYHTTGETYQLVPEKVYTISGDTGISKGSLVARAVKKVNNKTVEIFRLAQFPKDIDRVVGICPVSIPADSSVETSLLKNGNITLTKDSFKHITGDISDWSIMVGAPVYWFIGRSYFDGTTPHYIDPQEFPGKLTLATPSGIRWGLGNKFNDDNSLNVGYSNLPTVGTVVSVSGDNVTINVNISKFESELEWHWPYCINNSSEQTASTDIPGEITTETTTGDITENILSIRHGLFCKSTNDSSENFYAFRPRCFCNVLAMNTDDDTEHVVFAGVDNYYGDVETEPAASDKRTDITFKNYDGKKIYVSGKVVYTFDKQYD